MTAKVVKIIVGDQSVIVDRRDLKGLDLSSLRISSSGYAVVGTEFLHRLIMRPPKNMQVDHKNKDKLDNRRCNLRICTVSENAMNRGKTKYNTTGFKGVRSDKRRKRKIYRAQITANKKRYNLGSFEKPEAAGAAYKKAAKIYHGEFARTDDPLSVGVLSIQHRQGIKL